MKWLISLSAFQTLLLGVLALRVFAIEARTDDLAEASENIRIAVVAQSAKQGVVLPASTAFARSADIASLSADEVRAILREELAGGAQSPSKAGQRAQTAAPAPAYDQAATKTMIADIDRDLALYGQRGVMTTVETDLLGAKIAELPPAERREAMIRMTKAINSGRISAQF